MADRHIPDRGTHAVVDRLVGDMLAEHPDVRWLGLLSQEGFTVAAEGERPINSEALAARAAGLMVHLRGMADVLGGRRADHMYLEGDDNSICIIDQDPWVVIVVGAQGVPLGLLRYEARDIAQQLLGSVSATIPAHDVVGSDPSAAVFLPAPSSDALFAAGASPGWMAQEPDLGGYPPGGDPFATVAAFTPSVGQSFDVASPDSTFDTVPSGGGFDLAPPVDGSLVPPSGGGFDLAPPVDGSLVPPSGGGFDLAPPVDDRFGRDLPDGQPSGPAVQMPPPE